MTPEQKAGLMQLMGQTYGEAHKQDQMIIGNSGNLKPQSPDLKQQFEQVAKSPTVAPQQQLVQPPPAHQEQPPPAHQEQPVPTEIQQVTPEQAAQEIAAVTLSPEAIRKLVDTDNQLELDLSEPSKMDKLIDLTKEQNLILKQISLKLDNGKTAKGNKQK